MKLFYENGAALVFCSILRLFSAQYFKFQTSAKQGGFAINKVMFMNFSAILNAAQLEHASDVHVCADAPIRVRVAGRLKILAVPILSHNELSTWLMAQFKPAQHEIWLAGEQVDFALFDQGSGIRVRLSAYMTTDGIAVAVRLLSKQAPSLAELGAPEFLEKLKPFRHGLVLITGATGSGKSTTMASWIAHVNKQDEAHVVTLEDPIEYRFSSDKCLIHQSEVGNQVGSFSTALRDVLRRDPDAIVVGELRDLVSIELALRAAETGHLVIATLHSASAVEAISRLLEVFPSENKSFVRNVLSSVLIGVVAQRLVRCNTNVNKQGRIATYEVLTANAAVKNLIKEAKENQLPAVMQTSAAHQMFTFNQHYQKLLDMRLVMEAMPVWTS